MKKYLDAGAIFLGTSPAHCEKIRVRFGGE